jgi:hypothetical protein
MSSLSLSRIPRRFQVALLVVLALAVLWVAVLRNALNSGSNTSSETPSTPASRVHRPAPPAGAHAIARAHPAVGMHRAGGTHAGGASAAAGRVMPAHGQHTANATAPRPTAAPRHGAPAGPSHASATPHTGAAALAGAHHAAARGNAHAAPTAAASHPATRSHSTGVAHPGAATRPAHRTSSGSGVSATVRAIEGELRQGKVALVLFWDPHSVTDQFVRQELQAAGGSLGRAVATHYALASQVGEYGKFTQRVLITETPTLLVIAPDGQVGMLVGFNEAETIKRAVAEAQALARARSRHRP